MFAPIIHCSLCLVTAADHESIMVAHMILPVIYHAIPLGPMTSVLRSICALVFRCRPPPINPSSICPCRDFFLGLYVWTEMYVICNVRNNRPIRAYANLLCNWFFQLAYLFAITSYSCVERNWRLPNQSTLFSVKPGFNKSRTVLLVLFLKPPSSLTPLDS